MNSRERFNTIMAFEKPDRPFFTEYMKFWPETMDRWISEGYPAGVNVDEYFGFDRIEVIPLDFNFVPAFPVEILEEDQESRLIRDSTGVLKKEFKYGSAMPHYYEFPIKNRNDFLQLKERLNPLSPERYPANWDDLVQQYKQRDYVLYLICRGLFAFGRDFMDFNDLMMAFAEQPEWMKEMVDFHTDFLIRFWEKALNEVEVDYIYLGEDMAYKNGPMVSPKAVKEILLPNYRKLADFFRACGVRNIILDSDGDIRSLVPIFIEAGFTGILPLEAAASMDPVDIRQKYPRLQMVGGLDKQLIAKGGDTMQKEVLTKVGGIIKQGGYIPSFDHSVPPILSLEDYKIYLDFLRHVGQESF